MTAARWGNGLHTLRRFLAYGLDLRTAHSAFARALKVLYLVVAVFAQWRALILVIAVRGRLPRFVFALFDALRRRDPFRRFKLIQRQPSVSNQAPFSRSDEPAARATISQSAVKERAISAKSRHSNEHYEKWLQIRPEWMRCWRCGRAEKLQTARFTCRQAVMSDLQIFGQARRKPLFKICLEETGWPTPSGLRGQCFCC